MNKKDISKVAFGLIFVIATLLLFSLIIVFFLYFGTNKVVDRPDEVEFKDYQILRLDPTSKETFSGIVTQPEISVEHGFISKEEDGMLLLIHEFGSSEYHCTGTCSCSEDSRRGVSMSSTIIRTFSFLVAVLGSTVAMKHATEFFMEKCQAEMSDVCEESSILSVVDGCDEINYPHREYEMEVWENFEEFEEETLIYWCKGNCMPNVYRQQQPYYEKTKELYVNSFQTMSSNNAHEDSLVELYGCEQLEYETEVWIDLDHDFEPFFKKRLNMGHDVEKTQLECAKQMFMAIYLDDHCVKNSILDIGEMWCRYNVEDKWWKDCVNEWDEMGMSDACPSCEDGKVLQNEKPMCVAHDNAVKNGEGEFGNESVSCVKMEKKTQMYREQVLRKKEIEKAEK